MIFEKSIHELRKIIATYRPKGKFIGFEEGKYIAVDNSDGNSWTEEFNTREEAEKWLEGSE